MKQAVFANEHFDVQMHRNLYEENRFAFLQFYLKFPHETRKRNFI